MSAKSTPHRLKKASYRFEYASIRLIVYAVFEGNIDCVVFALADADIVQIACTGTERCIQFQG